MMGVREFLQEDDAQVALQSLMRQMKELGERLELLEILTAPKQEDRMFRKPFQQATVNPGSEGEVYRQEVPSGFVGVITRMGNDWYPNTFLTRIVDNRVVEPRIERQIAPVTDPIPTKVFLFDRVIWRAQNNDGIPHTFGVLTDGFFIPRKVAERVTQLEA